MFERIFNTRLFWSVKTVKLEESDYMVHVWKNVVLDEKHTVFFPQDLEGNWRELQRRRAEKL